MKIARQAEEAHEADEARKVEEARQAEEAHDANSKRLGQNKLGKAKNRAGTSATPNSLISGAVDSFGAGGRPVVNGVVVKMWGVEGIAEEERDQFSAWLSRHGGHMACHSLGPQGYRCITSDQIDVAQALLLNGASRTSPQAPDQYVKSEREAQLAKRGMWQ